MTHSQSSRQRGFTLAELIVAMGITAILLSLLVTVTSVAVDGWRVSRNKVRASRQAQAALQQLTRDLESMVVRAGNNFEWLHVSVEDSPPGPENNADLRSPNSSKIIFFTAATDRYDGEINTAKDKGGDVSCVGYRLFYKDPITNSTDEDLAVFVLYRDLVNPDVTFQNLLATEDLPGAFELGEAAVGISENFICENIYEMSVVFQVQYTERRNQGGTEKLVIQQVRVPVLSTSATEAVKEFSIRGNGIEVVTEGAGSEPPVYAKGRVTAVDVSISVLSDAGLGTLRRASMDAETRAKFLAKNTYRYTKSIMVPQP
ncbi:MAG: prepilin-type N-terminal cleavage/methylation domain-containing protein [Akkermansiaceae bacterium]|nr:prepilin-type N-terminal cleavage/methylation domain-containing protein [Akkermansiaceae bacterium]NNM29492.1 prepilin-type N-terminal cleavage/methylation domain-containing protein [Akkermansiaceae bacterium]